MNDLFGRPVAGMRISVTQRCNLSCIHCHREGSPESREEMTSGEIARIAGIGKKFGIRKVKISGGESLLRGDICKIVDEISNQGIEVTLTTNGFNLDKLAESLANSGLNGINISIHSINPETYCRITGNGELENVLNGIQAALDAGLFVKLNVVVFKGLNDCEIDGLIEFSKGRGILQLIELVNIGCMNDEIYKKNYYNLNQIEEKIKKKADSVQIRGEMHNRSRYKIGDSEIEIVRPFEGKFCIHCTRIRLTSDGKLKPCLMRNDNLIDILTPIRRNAPEKELEDLFREAVMRREPFKWVPYPSFSQSSHLSPLIPSGNP